jgi:hypothetical protein
VLRRVVVGVELQRRAVIGESLVALAQILVLQRAIDVIVAARCRIGVLIRVDDRGTCGDAARVAHLIASLARCVADLRAGATCR